MSKPGTPIWDRFWPRVDAEGDCWSWLGARTQGGYGYAWVDASHKHVRAHRLAWELLVGPIPDGLVLDHLCRVRLCVNPDHLEPVTIGINSKRGFSPNIVANRLGQLNPLCARGHERLPLIHSGACRQCKRITNNASKRRRREVALSAARAAREAS